MAIGIWVSRSLRYYAARHLAFAGTVALTSAILCAALLTGDSLQQGLQRGLRERLGKVRSAVYLSEGVFPAGLAQRLPASQAALLLRGELLTDDGEVCADKAQVIGLDVPHAFLNGRGRSLAAAGEGGVRFEKPALYSVEMPLGAAREARLARRAVTFGAPVAESLLTADFALRAASVPPVNVVMPHAALAEAAGVPGMANLLVSALAPEEAEQALAAVLTPEDAGLLLEGGSSGTVVKASRVFLPQGVAEALGQAGLATSPATFHLADAFESGTNATPYGFVAALAPDGLGATPDLRDDEIVVNAWLAEALSLQTNQTLTLRWRRFEAGGRLVADSRTFRVRAVVPTERAADIKRLMPVFPGLAGVDSCAAWDVGLPMDEAKLNDAANEAYWKRWRETPKAVVTYAAGRACFGSAFGEAMCLQVSADEPRVRAALRSLAPARLGFAVRPLWAEGLVVAKGATDFKGLFVGLAFVLIAAALMLSAFSLALALEMRKSEAALFGALGLSRAKKLRLAAAEWSVPLAAGAAAGGALGAALARALVWGLGRFWSDAFAGADLRFHFSWPVAAAAAAASAVLTLLALVRTAGRQAKVQPAELWCRVGLDGTSGPVRHPGWASAVGGLLAVAAGGIMVACPSGAAANGAFFGAGLLLMVSVLLFLQTAGAAWRPQAGGRSIIASACAAGICRALQAPRRSAPVVILLAVGTFLTIGILSMKHDPAAGCEKPSSGSGGFAAIVTSAVPLDRERGLELARRASGAKGVMPVRVHDGDEAGCLNMNQPLRPQVIGVEARAMARARAFEPEDAGGVWSPLEALLPDGAVPALAADQTMLQYSLKAKAGAADGAEYTYPGADGRTVRVRIVGALPVRSGILQGALIVDEKRFVQLFPQEPGYRMWLCDYAPYLLREAAESRGRDAEAARRLRHPAPGVTVVTVEERLRLLGAVEGTYLDMFLVLGGLGVVLGVAGISLVILRSVEERRGEFAVLRAVGLSRGAVVRLLAAEYGVMVAAGLAAGIVPALAAIQPAVRALRGGLPWGAMAGIVAGLVLGAAVCVLFAAVAAVRRFGPAVLKEEV